MACRQVRAAFTDRLITVYQAYSPQIAEAALAAGTFVAPFKRGRMTWVKPSFLWMMYRSGWATKPGQERILAVQITREGFEWALAHAALSHYDPRVHRHYEAWLAEKRDSPVRVQWDPDRSITLASLSHRAIQIGFSGEAVNHYLDHWIANITDITVTAHEARDLITADEQQSAQAMLPVEQPYELPGELRRLIGVT